MTPRPDPSDTTARPRWRSWAWAVASGVVLAVALPGLGWWPLAILAPGMLLESLRRVRRLRTAAALGWLAGLVHWTVAVAWVAPVMTHYGGLSWILSGVAVAFMGLVLGAGWALVAVLTAAVRPAFRLWLLPAAWVAMEAVWRFEPFRFPWNQVAAAFAATPALLGSLPVWGAAGLGWAALTVAAGGWATVHPAIRRSGAAAVAAGLVAAGVATALAPPPQPTTLVTVGMVQPGTSQAERWDPSRWQETARWVLAATGEVAAEGAELVLWPEGAVAFRVEDDPHFRRQLEALTADLEVDIVLNSIGRTSSGGWANAAYLVRPSGVAPLRYDKVKLVPFGEYVPAWASFLFSDALVREVGRFTPGAEPVLLQATTPLGVLICYEVVFPDLPVAQVRAGAGVLVSLTNDGWYGDSWAPRQHLAQAVLRAVETRRWVVRAALTGITAAVDPTGRRHAVLGVGERGAVVTEVEASDLVTPRVRWGDWWTVLCALAVLPLLVAGRRRRQA